MTTPNLDLPQWAAAQDQPWLTVNEALSRLDSAVQLSVISDGLNTPPASPLEGDRYIVTSPATGAWAGWEGRIAAFVSGVWLDISPKSGWLAWVVSRSEYYYFDTGWKPMKVTSPYDFGLSFGGTPTAAQTLARLSLPRNVTCAADLAGSVGHVGVAPTASFAIDMQVNGTSAGTITVDTNGVFSFISAGSVAVPIVAGSLVSFTAPAVADATISDISVTIAGTV